MVNEHYSYLSSKKQHYFSFVSEGRQGRVVKIVAFTFYKENRWNLGFGDLRHGEIDDSIVTNNHDLLKVIQTVTKIANDFFEQYPDRIVRIVPVDEKRKRLYNRVFQRHISEIKPNFEVTGFIGEESETYTIEKMYDFFEIKRILSS